MYKYYSHTNNQSTKIERHKIILLIFLPLTIE